MNTNHLKKFAQEARRKLLEQVGAKLAFVLTTDSAELREKTEQVKQLREELNRTTKEQLIEKVTYTWFNRLMALRFMDANDYQPMGIRVITPKDGYTTPELLDEAKRGNIPDDLKLKRQKVYDILDNRIPSTNPQNEAYKELLIAACNYLNSIFPFLFEKINDYTELLLPDDLTSDFSIIKDIYNGMLVEDCKNVEIIGWIYQFYISEKKDEVFASKTKVKKEDIPSATQLFTPRWIVEYMVQNTLGKLWLQNRPKSKLREHMIYFIESESLKSNNYLKVNNPEEIKLVDPACGSGHLLVYAFDLFAKIYEEEGYSITDIPKLIIEKNLYGFEIDERAAQLSGLALMMKAREYQRRAFRKDLKPNILYYQDLYLNNVEIEETFDSLKINISDKLMHDLLQMKQATNFGSLIIPQATIEEIINIHDKLIQSSYKTDIFLKNKIDALLNVLRQLQLLAQQFYCLVANPPYMGSGNMNPILSEFVKKFYPDSKADLMACFMESGLAMLRPKGFLGMINQQAWMFLSSYEELRKKIINTIFIDTLLHLGARTFPEIGGEVVQNASFTYWNEKYNSQGIYFRLVDFDNSNIKRKKTLEAIQNIKSGWVFITNQLDFEKIPSGSIGYWLKSAGIQGFKKFKLLSNDYNVKSGVMTGDDDCFLRFWYEVDNKKIGFNYFDINDIKYSNHCFFPLNKEEGNRKWSGRYKMVIKYLKGGQNFYNKRNLNFRLRENSLYFKEGISWGDVSGGNASFRYQKTGLIFAARAPMVFTHNKHLVGILNSKVANYYQAALNPTLSFNLVDLERIPIVDINSLNEVVIECIDKCIETTETEWNRKELSWDFYVCEFINHNEDIFEIEESVDYFKHFWKNKFIQLHRNEEELNRHFIEIYGLQEELTPNVPLEEITILQDELNRKELSELNKKLIRDPKTLAVINYHDIELPFNISELITQLISYSVGCMFGRYSLDKEGLILANQGETIKEYLNIIGKSANECTFLPDEDNIIPILDNEWFEDDVVSRFYKFLKITLGEKNFNKNIVFIEEWIGMALRKYFIKEFYPDHIKRYKKRPIYWMFSSSKGSFNVLIYMHRYSPDTVSNILNKYLKEFIGKLRTRKEHLQHLQVSGSPAEKTKAIKENDSIDKMLVELQEFERDILYPLATERIAIDLDEGVLVNYNKFGKAVKEVSGLNDPTTKKKVKEFDWIDSTQIK